MSSFYESRQRQPSIAMHWREYEDCKQILKLSLNQTRTLERPERQWPLPLARQSPQTFPDGQSGIRQPVFARSAILSKPASRMLSYERLRRRCPHPPSQFRPRWLRHLVRIFAITFKFHIFAQINRNFAMKRILTIITTLLLSSLVIFAQEADMKVGELLNTSNWFELERIYPAVASDVQSPMLKLMAEVTLASNFNRPD